MKKLAIEIQKAFYFAKYGEGWEEKEFKEYMLRFYSEDIVSEMIIRKNINFDMGWKGGFYSGIFLCFITAIFTYFFNDIEQKAELNTGEALIIFFALFIKIVYNELEVLAFLKLK